MGQHFVNHTCTNIAQAGCKVTDTVYGYYPSIPFNTFFVAFFCIATIVHLALGFRYKTWFYATMLVIGAISEAIGYMGRVLLHANPFDKGAFTMQITCLIYAPAFVTASIYVLLKHIVLVFGEERSRLPARYYTWIFITCDIISLVLQASGGGTAGSKKAQNSNKVRDDGTDVMMAGIVWQVFTLFIFGFLTIEYYIRTRRDWVAVPSQAKELASAKGFKLFAWGAIISYICIFARCAYRIIELAEGWANPIQRDQGSFIVLEGFMIVVAVLLLGIFHPGYCFPFLAGRTKDKFSQQENFSAKEYRGSSDSSIDSAAQRYRQQQQYQQQHGRRH